MNKCPISYKIYVQLYDENKKPLNQYLYMDKTIYDELCRKLKHIGSN